ncbi:MAG: 3-phosphoserine/phosphohydroxythreonine transaminase [Bacteroidetes bacterium]|nr:3-phosphoserine/phosphohydroxythreonine transaminase [Bacteroidota bacterium]
MKKHNFSAGPAILPASVLQKAGNAVHDLNGIGLSILEISHRSPEFVEILDRSVQLVKDLYQLSDDYAVLFLTGGASSQFFMSAMNLLDPSAKAAYLDTGSWSSKAIKEAKLFGDIEVLASSKDKNYNYIPKGFDVPEDISYLHLTSNNTIFGTQYHSLPDTKAPLVCDMSSDIFSRNIDVDRYGLIYAGAQKNMGPAGTTLVIVRKDLLGKVNREIPTMLNYETHIKKNSSFNTPPVYPIFVSMLTLEWVAEMGGLDAMEKHNREKAQLMYDAIDRNPLFEGVAEKEDRSWMNATFVMKYENLEKEFLDDCNAAGISGVKGHRSVGGFRASIYNAMPIDSIKVLIDVMDDFAQTHA